MINPNDTHSVAVFSRVDNATGKLAWTIRFGVRGEKGTPESTTNIYWKEKQSTWTNAEECELFCAVIRSRRQAAIHVHSVVDAMLFLEKLEGAALDKSIGIPVHANPDHFEQVSAASR